MGQGLVDQVLTMSPEIFGKTHWLDMLKGDPSDRHAEGVIGKGELKQRSRGHYRQLRQFLVEPSQFGKHLARSLNLIQEKQVAIRVDINREGERELAHGGERATMMRRESVGIQAGMMVTRPIPRVRVPVVVRVTPGERLHQPVARDLRKDGRARDRMTSRVAAHDSGMLDAQRANRETVDHDVIGRHGKAHDGASNCEHRRVIDVVAVDFTHTRRADRERKGTFADAHRQPFPLTRPKPLRIIDAADRLRVARHDDSACDDGARKGAPSDLIHTGEQGSPAATQLTLDGAPLAHAA